LSVFYCLGTCTYCLDMCLFDVLSSYSVPGSLPTLGWVSAPLPLQASYLANLNSMINCCFLWCGHLKVLGPLDLSCSELSQFSSLTLNGTWFPFLSFPWGPENEFTPSHLMNKFTFSV
jgi:hypothetical protein